MQVITKAAKLHTVTISAEDLKVVAVNSAKKQAGVVDDASVLSSSVDGAPDGSLTVNLVEAVVDVSTSKFSAASGLGQA